MRVTFLCRHSGGSYPFLTLVPGGGRWSLPGSSCLTPKKDPIPIVLEPGCTLQLVWMAWKSLLQPGFDPWTVQSVAGSFADCAILAILYNDDA